MCKPQEYHRLILWIPHTPPWSLYISIVSSVLPIYMIGSPKKTRPQGQSDSSLEGAVRYTCTIFAYRTGFLINSHMHLKILVRCQPYRYHTISEPEMTTLLKEWCPTSYKSVLFRSLKPDDSFPVTKGVGNGILIF